MGLISRWKLVWGPALGLLVGPLIACLGIVELFLVDARLFLSGAVLGLLITYLVESRTRRHSHYELLADLSAMACAATSVMAAGVRIVTPKRRWFRFSLATFFVLVTILGLCAGWLGNNLYRVRERVDIAERFLGLERPPILGWCYRVVVGPPLWPHIFIDEGISTDDLHRLQAGIPEAKIWQLVGFDPKTNRRGKWVLLSDRSVYQERALTDPEWSEDFSEQ